MNGPKPRSGFTLIEVVVAAVLLAILAATTTPTLINYLDKQRAQTTANILSDLQKAISGNSGFYVTMRAAGVPVLPGKLSELNNQLVATTYLMRNSCGGTGITTTNAFTGPQVTVWNAAAPYVGYAITPATYGATPTTGGLTTPMGLIPDSMTRIPAAPATTGTNYLQIRMPNVALEDAKTLDLIVDGVAGSGVGTVQYGAAASDGTVPLTYNIPVSDTRC
jgi:prepilin-type N-terminal cleavage/methylation domain-containing protein